MLKLKKIKTDKNKKTISLTNKGLSSSYQAVCCARVWRCWCPAGAPMSRCGRAAGWSLSWRRSRCPPRPPPCGTPPSPRPGGPPAVSGGQQQRGEAHPVNSHKDYHEALVANRPSSPSLVNMTYVLNFGDICRERKRSGLLLQKRRSVSLEMIRWT